MMNSGREIAAINSELTACATVDEVCKLAVTRCCEMLGTDRCAIFLREENEARGTWGVDFRSNLKRLDHVIIPWSEVEQLISASHFPRDQNYSIIQSDLRDDSDAISEFYGRGEVACTWLASRSGILGIVYNDNAISGKPILPEEQEFVSLLFSFVATIIVAKRAELKVVESDREYRQLFQCSPCPQFIVSPGGRIEECNTAFTEMVGTVAAEETLKLSLSQILGPKRFEELAGQAMNDGALEGTPVVLMNVTGELRYGSMTLIARKQEDNSVTGFHGFIQDMTPLVRSERALHELDLSASLYGDGRFFQELARHLCVALHVRFAIVTEYLDTEKCEANILGRVQDGEAGAVGVIQLRGACKQLLKSGYGFCATGADRLMEEGDSIGLVPVSYMGVLMMDDRGEPLGQLQIFDDKPMLEENRFRSIMRIFASRAAAELQRQRTQESLAQSRLDFLQAQKMEAIGQLAGGVAHDFNNLLTSILGVCDLMLLDLDPQSATASDVDHIKLTAQRAANLTRQLLAFSRKQILQPQIMNLNVALSKMEKMLRSLLREDVELDLVMDDSLGNVRVDETQVEQVVMNAVVNAMDALPSGGTISITTECFDLEAADDAAKFDLAPGKYACLSIRDDGEGIASEVIARVFDPYFTTKPKDKGTGLGLSTVYGIAKQSGGAARIASSLGTGTVLKVFLPEVTGTTAVADVAATPPRPKTRSHEGQETILLVEDEDVVRRPIKMMLMRHGYTVFETRSSGEALLIAERGDREIDLMITDVVMPTMNGYELYLRVEKVRPTLRVIFISGYSDEVISRQGVLKPGLDFIQKPFTQDVLLQKVREVLDSPILASEDQIPDHAG